MPENTKKETKNEVPNCPVCGKNDEVVPIAYGYPGMEMMEASMREEIKLGGCVLGGEHWFCKRDDESF
jgi:hypothetical protein